MDTARPLIWQAAIASFAIAVALIIIFRANPPKPAASATTTAVTATTGRFVEGPLTIAPGKHLAFKFNLDSRSRLIGNFSVEKFRGRVACSIVDPVNYRKLVEGSAFETIVATGPVPVGRIDRMLQAGNYYVVFDNSATERAVVLAIAEFDIE